MKSFIIDYTRPDGRSDFKVVRATSAEAAVNTFNAAGIDGWTGYRFDEYHIKNVSER